MYLDINIQPLLRAAIGMLFKGLFFARLALLRCMVCVLVWTAVLSFPLGIWTTERGHINCICAQYLEGALYGTRL